MPKKNKNQPQPQTEDRPVWVEKAFIVRKLSLQEWQIVDLEIEGDQITERREREPDVAAIVSAKLATELRKLGT